MADAATDEEPNSPGLLARVAGNLVGPWQVLLTRRGLIFQLVRQEIKVTYARSLLGLYWIALLPIFYVAVFIGVRFVALDQGANEWLPDQAAPETTAWQAFAIVIGLLVFWFATDILSRSAGSVLKYANLVTDLKFPVEVLPWVTVGVSVFNFVVRFLLMVLAYAILVELPHWQMVLVPLALIPLLVVMVGVSYLFAAVGVFISDLEYVIQILMTALLLLSGVLFPLSIVPEPFRTWLYINPIAFAIRDARALGLYGESAEWLWLGVTLFVGLIMAGTGFWIFRRLRPRFSDAL